MKYEDRLIETDLGMELLCVRCCEYWPLDFFQPIEHRYHSYCKGCNTEFQRKRRAKLPKRPVRRQYRWLTYEGETLTLAAWARRIPIGNDGNCRGVHWKTLAERIGRLKWPLEKALTTPPRRYGGQF